LSKKYWTSKCFLRTDFDPESVDWPIDHWQNKIALSVDRAVNRLCTRFLNCFCVYFGRPTERPIVFVGARPIDRLTVIEQISLVG